MTKERNAKKFGFTLMELLAVMSIMGLLTTVAVTSYFSAINGMAKRSAVKHVVNALVLARQRACMEGVRVSVVFFNELKGYRKDENDQLNTSDGEPSPTFVVCRAIGRISYKDASTFGDEFADLGEMFKRPENIDDDYSGRIKIYNLTHGGWWDVKPWVKQDDLQTRPLEGAPQFLEGAITVFKWATPVVAHNMDQSKVCVGDVYGVEAVPASTLPKTFFFQGFSNEKYVSGETPIIISFKPDGSLDTSHGGVTSVTIVEQRGSTSHTKQITVDEDSGSVDGEKEWN